jgi:DNA-binding transcriptional MocR family regulator
MNRLSGRTAATIAASLEQAIADGQWAAGTPLPTVRALAGRLHVAPATVAGAYRLLRDRGLTAGGGRRGTRVRTHLPQVAIAEGVRDRRAPGATHIPGDGIDLTTGQPDPELLPSFNAALRTLTGASMSYPTIDVVPALASFASSEFAADGIPAGPIAVTNGALDAVERILRERLRPGDRVAIEDPSLPALIQLIAAARYHPVPVSVDANGPAPDSLAAALAARPAAFVMTPRAHNPTGAALTPERAAELKRVLQAAPDVLLIENDAAAAIAGTPAFSLVDRRRDAWAVVRSCAKALGPDLRVAVVTGDVMTITRLRARQALGARWVSHVLQRLALAMWSDPAAGRQLARAAALYAARRQALTHALGAHGIETMARSGFNVWVPVRQEHAVCRALAEEGWVVAAGEPFRLRSGPGVRITTSALAPADAPRLAAAVAAVQQRLPVPLV